ncbi:MAG: PilZ domain-containing protein [Phycisphaerales bacterium]|nr:MAG: PilZ domain-containing protein [Phycisphaerales bacterium]
MAAHGRMPIGAVCAGVEGRLGRLRNLAEFPNLRVKCCPGLSENNAARGCLPHIQRGEPMDGTRAFSDHDSAQPLVDNGPFRFERRTLDRWPVNVLGTAFELGGTDFGRTHDLQVTDFSEGGLGAISGSSITPGSIVSIGFSAPGMIAKRGTVIRCQPSGEGYRIAILFEQRMAA